MSGLDDRFETVIGLEMHVQLRTHTKIFCRCSAAYGAPPNTQVCPVCLGHPGVLPVLNRRAVDLALRFGLAVGASVEPRSLFARKNYFYPDLPKGYQISQYDRPILTGGTLSSGPPGSGQTVRLVRAHLEEDAGKSFHLESGHEPASLIDLNRSGVPLLEVVTEPDLRTPGEARSCLERLRQLVVYLEICDGNMEEGSLRADANISVRPRGQEALNPKTEVKNLNSFRNVERALEWERKRQSRLLEDGEALQQATRLWDDAAGRTRVMRTKEEAEDYRYFPEPDLRPLVIDPDWVESVRKSLPELPEGKEHRLASAYGLSASDAAVLASTRELADFYEAVVATAGDGKAAANWVMTEVMHLAKETGGGVAGLDLDPRMLGKMIRMIGEDRITGKIGKEVFGILATDGGDPEDIVKQRGLGQIEDTAELDEILARVIEENPGPAAEFAAGKRAALQFLIGQVMRLTRGRANPRLASEGLRRILEDGPEDPDGD